MKRISLGTGSLQSSRLAYGCWRLSGAGSPGECGPGAEAVARRAVIAAFESGYTLFDHADVYGSGLCEILFGRVLKEVHGMRDGVVLASKCGIRKAGDPGPDAPYRYDFSATHIIGSCEASLRRLGVDFIDLYQLHRPDFLMDPMEVAAAFSQLAAQGKAREFGVSNFLPHQADALQKACKARLAVNQVQISLAHLDCFVDGTLEHCLRESITPLAWSPLGRGILGGVERSGSPTEAGQNVAEVSGGGPAARAGILAALDAVAREHGVGRSAIAFAWLLKHPAKIIPIVGSTKPERIREAVQAVDIELSREQWYRLMEAAMGTRLP